MLAKQSFSRDFIIPFFLLVLLFSLLRHDLFVATNLVPVNDFAANDLLVVDAKSYSLLHGNYSRVGFYHPGPFFFQLMAWSEQLLHDELGLVRTPIGTSVLAALLLNAFGMAALFFSLVTFFQNRLHAGLGLLVSVVVACHIVDTRDFYNAQLFFLTAWPPMMYMGAALLLQAGVVGLVAGARYGLPVTVAALMMLVHGHASFIGLAPIMAICIALFFLVQARLDGKGSAIGSAFGYLRSNRISLMVTCGIVFVFCLPILMNTLRHWPGEIPKYFAFAGQQAAPSVGGILHYWSTFLHWSLVLLPAFILFSYVENKLAARRLMYAVLATTLPAAAFYSVRGLDTLDYKYPLFWVAPAIGVAMGIAAIELVRTAPHRAYRFGWLIFWAVFATVGFSQYARQGVYESLPAAEFESAVRAIRTLQGAGKPIPVEIDNAQVVPIVYATTLASVDKRMGGQGFCIVSASWNIAYTEKYKCDAARYPEEPKLKLKLGDGKAPALFKIGEVVGVPL